MLRPKIPSYILRAKITKQTKNSWAQMSNRHRRNIFSSPSFHPFLPKIGTHSALVTVQPHSGGPVVKKPPANAGTWVRSLVLADPNAPGKLSPWATTTDAHKPRAHDLQQEKPLQWEAHALHLDSSRCSLQLEKALVQQRRPRAAKINKLTIFLNCYYNNQKSWFLQEVRGG